MSALRRLVPTGLCLMLAAGCASYPKNAPLARYDADAGYRYQNLVKSPGNSESLFVILTFSGGGTRAAALSYGVLEKLRDTKIRWEGEERSLLDEVDVISSVSGGSFTAAYYGLFRDELFDPEKFRKAFLYRNIERELVLSLLNPYNWFRLASPTFGRIEIASELYDDEIFEKRTFATLVSQAKRPFIMLNATDITMGARFTFVQDQFDLVCSDLGEFSVARAVAASSNFPLAFSPMTIDNYSGNCTDYHEPPWFETAAKDLETNPARFNRYRIASSYLDAEKRKYVHLLDGGVSDNLGLRGPLTAITSNDSRWNLPSKINRGKIEKLVVIVVDARTDPHTDVDQSPSPPGTVDIVDIIASVPMGNYSFDTVQLLLKTFEQWRKDRLAYSACEGIVTGQCPGGRMPGRPPAAIETYGIYVGFDQLEKRSERERFLNLPTTFYLPKDEVDELRRVGGKILEKSDGYRELTRKLRN